MDFNGKPFQTFYIVSKEERYHLVITSHVGGEG